MSKQKAKANTITKVQVEQFEMLVSLLRSSYSEVKELSKKKPDGALSNFKVNLINKILIPLKDLFANESVNQFLELLDTDTLPYNSDAVLVMGQYIAAAESFKNKRMIEVPEPVFDGVFTSKEWNLAEDKK